MESLELAKKVQKEKIARGDLMGRRKRFADFIIAGEETVDAYLKAGYPDGKNKHRIARRMLKQPIVVAYLRNFFEAAKQRNDLKLDEVIRNYRDLVALGIKENKLGDAVKANEGLARIIGAFNDSVQVNHSGSNPFLAGRENAEDVARLRKIAQGRKALKTEPAEGNA